MIKFEPVLATQFAQLAKQKARARRILESNKQVPLRCAVIIFSSSRRWLFPRGEMNMTGWKRCRQLRAHIVFERTFSNWEAKVVLHPLNTVGAGGVTVAIV